MVNFCVLADLDTFMLSSLSDGILNARKYDSGGELITFSGGELVTITRCFFSDNNR
jgi:hypothetical protein